MIVATDVDGERLCPHCRETSRPVYWLGDALLYRCAGDHQVLAPKQQRRGLVNGAPVVGCAGEIDGR